MVATPEKSAFLIDTSSVGDESHRKAERLGSSQEGPFEPFEKPLEAMGNYNMSYRRSSVLSLRENRAT